MCVCARARVRGVCKQSQSPLSPIALKTCTPKCMQVRMLKKKNAAAYIGGAGGLAPSTASRGVESDTDTSDKFSDTDTSISTADWTEGALPTKSTEPPTAYAYDPLAAAVVEAPATQDQMILPTDGDASRPKPRITKIKHAPALGSNSSSSTVVGPQVEDDEKDRDSSLYHL